MVCILWRYVTTACIHGILSPICKLWRQNAYDGDDTYYVPATLLVYIGFGFIFSKTSSQAKVWDFWIHFVIQQNIAGFQISVDYS